MMEVLTDIYESDVYRFVYRLYLLPTALLLLYNALQQVWAERHGRPRPKPSVLFVIPVLNLEILLEVTFDILMWISIRIERHIKLNESDEYEDDNGRQGQTDQ